ncbi:Elongator complex protein 2-like protein 1 [Elsinoe fawcettii]|nr:Elongator complex protein 2-like protein 1 [Elsinoe fawcettii]
MPRASARLMGSLAGESDVSIDDLPDSANIPVLGLSNKAVTSGGADEGEEAQDGVDQEKDIKAEIALDQPPLEDVLARHTLWPEHEKLYGHGYEISMVTASHDHKLVATACRASSIDHAVIRLYETGDWREIRPPLSGHTLTVTSLAFSPDDTRLLSVGRDRQWMVYKKEPGESPEFELHSSNPKGHSRMILDCSWAPAAFGDVFATAGRDKTVKIWHKGEADPDYSCKLTIPAALPVTAVAFSTRVVSTTHSVLAFGTEEGEVAIVRVDSTKWTVVAQSALPSALRPAGSINALRWRPQQQQQRDDVEMLAVASDDHSVRLYDVQIDYNQE